jgi:hypothetical protein
MAGITITCNEQRVKTPFADYYKKAMDLSGYLKNDTDEQNGLDPRYSNFKFYGLGVYIAEEARYGDYSNGFRYDEFTETLIANIRAGSGTKKIKQKDQNFNQ